MAIGIGLVALTVVFAGVAFLTLILLGIGRLVQAGLEHPGLRHVATGAAVVLGFLFGLLVYQWLAFSSASQSAHHEADAVASVPRPDVYDTFAHAEHDAIAEARRIDRERHFAEVAARPANGVTNVIRGQGNVVRVDNMRVAQVPNVPREPVAVAAVPQIPAPQVPAVPPVPDLRAQAPALAPGHGFVPPKGAMEANRDGIKIFAEDGTTVLQLDDDGIRVGNTTIDKNGIRVGPDGPAKPASATSPPRAATSQSRARAKAVVANAVPDQPPLGWDGPTEPRRKRPAWVDGPSQDKDTIVLTSLLSASVEDARTDLLKRLTTRVREELPPGTPADLALPNPLAMRTIEELWWESSPSERLGQDMLRLHALVRFKPAFRDELAALVRRRVAAERAEQFTFWGLGLLGGLGLVWGASRLATGGQRPTWPPETAAA